MSWNRRTTRLRHGTLNAAATLLATFLSALAATPQAMAAGAETKLPASLAQWYKPQNKRQVWLHTMFSLRRELQAVREYAREGDEVHLRRWADRLDQHYRRLPQMVPEWSHELDLTLLDELNERIKQNDFKSVIRASERLERDCRSCHRQYQALAALTHRWPRFDHLRVADGEQDHAYSDFKDDLTKVVNRIKIATEDQRWPVAEQSLITLRKKLQHLGESCTECHRDSAPRERILGNETEQGLEQLQQALKQKDGKTAGRRLGTVAVKACARCHGVHRLLSETQRWLSD